MERMAVRRAISLRVARMFCRLAPMRRKLAKERRLRASLEA